MPTDSLSRCRARGLAGHVVRGGYQRPAPDFHRAAMEGGDRPGLLRHALAVRPAGSAVMRPKSTEVDYEPSGGGTGVKQLTLQQRE
ncbi:hypothetical protein OQI_14680 [Streptomyces pharetrae CZA14]|uniref:Uncharacterized protein n=1 Tax=Streptomyces pharetrae CZA14 TaxID=1144883 RepID=A0ABX3YIJ3_9ACTN|nr:hypothetical protein OQI_14680 [Streptomyces pharetrae CZA14]